MGTMLKELRYSLYLTTHPFKVGDYVEISGQGKPAHSGLLARGVYLAFGSVGLLHGLSFQSGRRREFQHI